MDLLKREHAPILPAAWDEIDAEATRVLKLNLAGRKLVDFVGPGGWEQASVNLGQLQLLDQSPVPGVAVGLRRVLPLIELRTPIKLALMELDGVARGARDIELGPVVDAAEKLASFEDRVIFEGFEPAGVKGMLEVASNQPLRLPAEISSWPAVLVEARERVREHGISGPYGLALPRTAYARLASASEEGYPLRPRIMELLGGAIVGSTALEQGALVSLRGGDFELHVGQDLAVGYADRSRDQVELYLTESLSFRVLEPRAVVPLELD